MGFNEPRHLPLIPYPEGMSVQEEIELERQQEEYSRRLVCDSDWWNDQLEGINGLTNELPRVLSRVMANLDAACLGDDISRTAVLTALSNLQRKALADARADAEALDQSDLERKLEDMEVGA